MPRSWKPHVLIDLRVVAVLWLFIGTLMAAFEGLWVAVPVAFAAAWLLEIAREQLVASADDA
jgi:hypothetical protein